MSLYKYQQRAVEHIMKHDRCALHMDMGLGKTLTTITAIKDLPKPAIILAPKRVITHAWPEELQKWNPEARVISLTGTAKERVRQLKKQGDIYLINFELIPWLVDSIGAKWRWPTVVIDESSRVKSRATKLFKYLKKVAGQWERLIELTGTPAPNGLEDLWSQIYLLDRGERLGRTITAFRTRWFRQDYMGWGWEALPHAQKEIEERIKDLCLAMTADDYLDLPERIVTDVVVDLPNKARTAYNGMKKEMVADIGHDEVTAFNAATALMKLLQITSGSIYDENGDTHRIHDAKIEALKEIIEQTGGEPIAVVYQFRSEMEAIKKAIGGKDVRESNAIEDWNKGKLPVLLLHPACLHPSTEVLTENRGWVKIIEVGLSERVFDGIEFVNHKGCSYSGYKDVIYKFGVTLTPNHKLLIGNEWIEAKNVRDSESVRSKALYKYTGDDNYLSEMLSMRMYPGNIGTECSQAQQIEKGVLWKMCRRQVPQYDKYPYMEYLAAYASEMRRSIRQALRGEGDKSLRLLAEVREFLSGYVQRLFGQLNYRAYRCEQGVLQGELSLGHKHGAAIEQKEQQKVSLPRREDTLSRVVQAYRYVEREDNAVSEKALNSGGSCGSGESVKIRKSKVYDLVDCGPRNRFLIRNSKGEVFISHNSAGHGLNLQYGGSNMVWMTPTFNLEHYQQTNARLHRNGQVKPVMIYRIVADNSVDSRVLRVIEGKADMQSALMEALK